MNLEQQFHLFLCFRDNDVLITQLKDCRLCVRCCDEVFNLFRDCIQSFVWLVDETHNYIAEWLEENSFYITLRRVETSSQMTFESLYSHHRFLSRDEFCVSKIHITTNKRVYHNSSLLRIKEKWMSIKINRKFWITISLNYLYQYYVVQ